MGVCVNDTSEAAVGFEACVWAQGPGKAEEEHGEGRGGLVAPRGPPAGVGAGAWQPEASARQVGWLWSWENAWTLLPSSLGAPGPKVPTASLFLLPLRTGLAGPLNWSSRSDRPFEYEHMPGSLGAGALTSAFLIYIHIRAAHSQA